MKRAMRWIRSVLTGALTGGLIASSAMIVAVAAAEASGADVLQPLLRMVDRAATRANIELPTVVAAENLPFAPQPSRVVYLNREGAVLRAGVDDATKNVSSIVRSAGQTTVDIPGFTGTNSRWNSIVKCVQSKLAPFDVEIVDRRPVDQDHMMVVFGGTAAVLGETSAHHHATGLAPFNGAPIENAVVMVFSGATKNNNRTTCETAAQEIGHAYGLDHVYDCHDLMTYRPYCGTKSFVNRDVKCGEHSTRECVDGSKTQNSHQVLMSILGPRNRNLS